LCSRPLRIALRKTQSIHHNTDVFGPIAEQHFDGNKIHPRLWLHAKAQGFHFELALENQESG
jgi:hypothetical protein